MLTKLKGPSNNNQMTENYQMIENSSRLPNILKKHFANVGNLLASKLPKKDNYMSYLSKLKSTDSSFFSNPLHQKKLNRKFYLYQIINPVGQVIPLSYTTA